MSLDEGVSALIGRIYEGAHDRAVGNEVLDEVTRRTNSRFIMVSTVDLRRGGAISTDFHGPQDARFLDGVRDYDAAMHRSDLTLAFGTRYPDAGFVSTALAAADQGLDLDDLPYLHWTRDVLGVGHSVVRYTPVHDGLLFGVSLHCPASSHVHDPADLALFALLFRHMDNARRLAARPPDLLPSDKAWLLLDDVGRIVSANAPAETLLAH